MNWHGWPPQIWDGRKWRYVKEDILNIEHAKKVLEFQEKKFPPWSYSNLNDYLICPRRYYRRHVLKDLPPEEKTEAQLKGTAVHEAFRKRIRRGDKLKDELAMYEPLLEPIMQVPVHQRMAELKLGMREDGTACDFFADDVWGRGAVDAVLILGETAWLVDWKTGKMHSDPLELELQALLLKANYPSLERIVGNFVWLRNVTVGKLLDLSDTVSTRAWVDEKLEEIQSRTDWPPDENYLCRFCNVTDCEYHRA